LFDTGVLMGVRRAAQFLQASLGHTVDGKITSKTLTAANAADLVALTKKILDRREARLKAIVQAKPSQKVFLKGWMNRLNDLRKTVGLSVPEAAAFEDTESLGIEPKGMTTAMARAESSTSDDLSLYDEDESLANDSPGEPDDETLTGSGRMGFLNAMSTRDFLKTARGMRIWEYGKRRTRNLRSLPAG
jgi:lysozyme family protein